MKVYLITTLMQSIISVSSPYNHGLPECKADLGIHKFELKNHYNKYKMSFPDPKNVNFYCVKSENLPEVGKKYYNGKFE